jgi:antitoxin ParD1/3/4
MIEPHRQHGIITLSENAMEQPDPITITVPADVADQVQARINRGAYASDGEVLRKAMHALEQQEKLTALRAMVDASINDPRPGLTAEQVEARLDQRAASYGASGDHA